jgi:membrane protein
LTALERLSRGEMLVNAVLTWINFLFAFVLVATLFATIYKVLPSVKIAWRDVTIGSFVTALLFTAGKFAIGAYIGNSGVASTYGAAGSVVLILIWVYYSAQILLYGAEFTHAFAYRFGSYAKGPGDPAAGHRI